MPATMPAYRLVAWEQAPQLAETAVPVPAAGQILIRVAACGLCHSDLDMMAMPAAMGEGLGWSVPFTLGHESAGWVEAVGPGVFGLDREMAVAVSSPSSCGACRWCRSGRDNACPAGLVGRGYGRDGGLAGYLLVDDVRSVLPIGTLDPVLAAPLTDAGATSHHAVARVLPRLRPDGVVVVLGVGGLGAFVVQILRARSTATVIAIDPDPVRRELALRFGASHALDGVGQETSRELRSLLGGDRADAVIDLVGTDETIACASSVLAAGGVLGLVGAAGGTLRRPWFSSLPRDGEVFTFQGSDLADAAAVLALAGQGAIEVPVVPYALTQVAEAYDALRGGSLTGRIVVVP